MSTNLNTSAINIAAKMGLNEAEKEEFLRLVNLWSAGQDTMAAIEPQDDHKNDVPLLEKFAKQDKQYDTAFLNAPKKVQEAMKLLLS
jgi:hypothetical protein